MRTREVAEICGVSIPTITENAKKIGIVLENGKIHEWTEDELKRIQIQLTKNQVTQGTQTELVKNEALTRFKGGLAEVTLMRSGDVDAMKAYCEILIQKTQAEHDLMIEQRKTKQLQIENSQLTHALEYDKVKDWKSWSKLKAELKPIFEIFRHRISFNDVVNDVGLIKGEDYEEKVMGRDTRPTKLVSPEGEDKIFDWYDTHTF